MRISSREGVEWLRRNGVEERVDRVCVGSLHTRVGLKTKPCGVVRVDVVVDAGGLHLLMVVAGVRDTLPIGATVAAWGNAGSRGAIRIERASQHRERHPAGVPIK